MKYKPLIKTIFDQTILYTNYHDNSCKKTNEIYFSTNPVTSAVMIRSPFEF